MISLLITTPVRFYREGLAAALTPEHGIAVESLASTAAEAIERIAAHMPDAVLLDTDMPGAFELLADIAHGAPSVRVVALAVRDSESDVLHWVEAGAAAYVTRDSSIADLTRVVHSAMRGEVDCSPRIAGTLARRVAALSALRDAPAGSRPPRDLTGRELETLELIERGMTNKGIARQLGIAVPTVKNHVQNILRKMKVHRRAEAAARVRRPPTYHVDEVQH